MYRAGRVIYKCFVQGRVEHVIYDREAPEEDPREKTRQDFRV